MVVRRTIEQLRERPKDERNAFAASVAIGVVAVLFVGWLIYFFHNITTAPAVVTQTQQAATSSAADQQQQALQQMYGSSTQYIDTEGNLQIEEVSSSTTYQ